MFILPFNGSYESIGLLYHVLNQNPEVPVLPVLIKTRCWEMKYHCFEIHHCPEILKKFREEFPKSKIYDLEIYNVNPVAYYFGSTIKVPGYHNQNYGLTKYIGDNLNNQIPDFAIITGLAAIVKKYVFDRSVVLYPFTKDRNNDHNYSAWFSGKDINDIKEFFPLMTKMLGVNVRTNIRFPLLDFTKKEILEFVPGHLMEMEVPFINSCGIREGYLFGDGYLKSTDKEVSLSIPVEDLSLYEKWITERSLITVKDLFEEFSPNLGSVELFLYKLNKTNPEEVESKLQEYLIIKSNTLYDKYGDLKSDLKNGFEFFIYRKYEEQIKAMTHKEPKQEKNDIDECSKTMSINHLYKEDK